MRPWGFSLNRDKGEVALNPIALQRAVSRTERLGRPWRLMDTVASTNDTLAALADRGCPEGMMIIARRQLAGRGRAGRGWVSEAGRGLWFSVLLRPELTYPAAGLLPVAVGFGVTLALRQFGLPSRLKWPNDILVGGRKIAGVLVEGRLQGERLAIAVVGIGLNWSVPIAGAEGLRAPATGLAAEIARAGAGDLGLPAPADVLGALLRHVEKTYFLLRSAGPDPFLAAWPGLSAHMGRLVGIADGRLQPWKSSPEGSAAAEIALAGNLLPDGSLEITVPGGGRGALLSGDISPVRT